MRCKLNLPGNLMLGLLFSVLLFSQPYSRILEQGPFSIGFTTLEKYDNSRTILNKYDYFGAPTDGIRARPIQICIWYPAKTAPDQSKMVLGEYNFPYPDNSQFMSYLSEIQNREIRYMEMNVQGDQRMVLYALNNEKGAVKKAPHADGKFQLIVFGPDMRKGITENIDLFEYLASHGFVVAAIHSVGSFDLNSVTGSKDLETLVRDMEFATAAIREQPYIDNNKLGLLGYGFGAAAAMLLQMRNFDIDAIACLNAFIHDDETDNLAVQNPFFDINRMNMPSLHIYKDDGTEKQNNFINKLKFSQRYNLKFAADYDACFTNYNIFAALKQNPSGELSKANIKGFETTALYMLNFFKAYLKNDPESEIFLKSKTGDKQNSYTFISLPGGEVPPTEAQFMSIINNRSVETAVEIYYKFKPSNPEHVFFNESTLNILGYRHLQTGRANEAVALFKMNVDSSPNSANAWDSYGEACMAVENYELALINYKKALEILPADSNINEEFRNVIRTGASAQIDTLETLINQRSE